MRFGFVQGPCFVQQNLDHVAAVKFRSYSTRGFHENGVIRTPRGLFQMLPIFCNAMEKTEAFVTMILSCFSGQRD